MTSLRNASTYFLRGTNIEPCASIYNHSTLDYSIHADQLRTNGIRVWKKRKMNYVRKGLPNETVLRLLDKLMYDRDQPLDFP